MAALLPFERRFDKLVAVQNALADDLFVFCTHHHAVVYNRLVKWLNRL